MFRISTEVAFKFISEFHLFGGCKCGKCVKDIAGVLRTGEQVTGVEAANVLLLMGPDEMWIPAGFW